MTGTSLVSSLSGTFFNSANLTLPIINLNETLLSATPDFEIFDDNENDHNEYINNLNKLNDNYNDSYSYKSYHRCNPDNPQFNCTEEEFIKYARGPQQIPIRILVTIIFGATFITGVVGNVIVCVVIVRQSTMHTATNYYLFSLAVSDLMFLLLGLPYEISLYWHQYPYSLGLVFCKLRALVSEASTYVSVLTIVAFSMERFLAICHPLHLYAMSGFKRALRIIAALWIISFFSAIPFAIYTNIDYLKYPVDNSTIQKSAFCAMLENPPGLHELSFCLFFVIPMVLIIILYGRMGIAIRSRKSAPLGIQTGSLNKESRHQKSRKAVVRMLAAVVITFFICWAPFHAQRLLYLYAQDWKHFQSVNEYLFFFGGWFYYVTCTINPILYNVMSHRYRVAFKETLCGKRRGSFYSNGFGRDQASFRTTIASSGTYDRVQSMRIRSIPNTNTLFKDRESIKSNNSVKWKKNTEFTQPTPNVKNPSEEQVKLSSNVVVVVDISINGRPKVYTENNVEENLLKKNETYI